MMSSKTILIATLAAVLVAAPTTAAPLLDYVDNGSFETFEDGDPADWRVLAGNVSATATAAEGDQAAQFALGGENLTVGIAQNISLLHQGLNNSDPPTPSGTSYEFNFSAKLGTGQQTEPTESPTANATVLWKNALGQVVDEDTISIEQNPQYQDYEVVLQAPLPEPGELPVTEAEIQFTLERKSLEDRTDVDLFVDSVEFGPVLG